MSKQVPLVTYNNGRRVTVGTAELADGKVVAHVTDPEIKALLSADDMSHFSIAKDGEHNASK